MVLVDYSDSGSSDGDNSILVTTTKSPLKRKRSTQLSTTERLAVLPAPESLHDLNPPLAAAKGPLTRKCGTKVDAIRRAGVDSCLPPLPDSFHDLYSSSTRNARQDDPSLHAGRQRSTPHVQGNWPTHVYAEWYPSKEESSYLHELMTKASELQLPGDCYVHSLVKSALGVVQPLHISLSRSIVLLTHERDSFEEILASEITKSNIRPFKVRIHGLDWVANQEKTRWFLVLRIEKSSKNELARLLHISNGVAATFGQPPLYEEPQLSLLSRSLGLTSADADNIHSLQANPRLVDVSSHFHISIGWSLEPPSKSFIARLEKEVNLDNKIFQLNISNIKVKVGNRVTAMSLPSKIVDTSNGIIGF